VGRQFRIYERALKKFKGDVSLWVEYIALAKRAGARALAGRVVARALQMHPHEAGLYVLGAREEMAQGSASGARALLQRGLRLNATSVELWMGYVQLEVWFATRVQRRWRVLGVTGDVLAVARAVVQRAAQGGCEYMRVYALLTDPHPPSRPPERAYGRDK
jgi:U3 small nucleolar RNA-associated protein 6